MNKNFFSDKAKRKIKEKRFYIVLACCIVAIGAITFTNSIPKNENTPAENKSSDVEYSLPEPILETEENKMSETKTFPPPEEEITNTIDEEADNLKTPAPSLNTSKQETDLPADESVKPTEEPGKAVNSSNDPPLRKITAPTDGKILAAYNKSPAYSSVMGDWRTHEAIDYAAKEGSEIAAADSGKILKIKASDLYGATIIIDHENTMKTLYANVCAKDGLKEGDIVTKGDIIGTVENTSVCEKHDECHIHFEVMVNDKNINPAEWLE